MDENQDLWRQIKAAKDHLFTQTAFLQKYTTAFPVSITTGKTSAPFTTRADTSLTNLPDNINTGPLQETSVSTNTQGKQGTSIWRERGSVILDASQRAETDLTERKQWESSSRGCSPLKDCESVHSLSTAIPIALPHSSASSSTWQNQGAPFATSDTLSSRWKQPAASQSKLSRAPFSFFHDPPQGKNCMALTVIQKKNNRPLTRCRTLARTRSC